MAYKTKTKRLFLILGRIVILAYLAIVAAVALSGRFADFRHSRGLVFVLLGGIAMALMSFSIPEIGAAFKQAAGAQGTGEELRISALFWESSARNVWMLGVTGSVINFANALSTSIGGLANIASGMAISLVPTVYGMILGAICMVPAWKLAGKIHQQSPQGTSEIMEKPRGGASARFETLIGYLLFITILAWAAIKPIPSAYFMIWDWIFYWPALLVVLGGTIALVLFIGDVATGTPFTVSFALTALIGSLMGFIQVLLGFAERRIMDVASALTFVISSCFIALLGIMLVGAPLEDRMVKAGKIKKHSALSRVAWYVFPLVTLIFLALTFVLVITPIKKG